MCALVVVGMLGPAASAHDHRPPSRPVLTIGDARQRGRPISELWLERIDADECEMAAGWSDISFPRSVPFESGSAATVGLRKEAPPVEWEIRMWDRVDRRGRVEGEGHPVPAVLVPGEGATGWALQFAPDPVTRHAYIRLDVFWQDEEGCSRPPDLGSQTGRWTYHLRAS